MAESLETWFVVRPGAQRKGKLIDIPFMYIGKETLVGAEVVVFGEHISGVSRAGDGGRLLRPLAELGNLVSGDEFSLTIHTDGALGPLAFTLDLLANESHLRKLRVEAPEPVSVPVVTEHPEC
jgi:hypothetical protein